MTEKKDSTSPSNFSKLGDHKRHGKTLTPPFMQIPGIELLSWHDKRLPEVLWAALLAHTLPRHAYMKHLSEVAKVAMRFRDRPDVYPEHTLIANLSADDFKILLGSVLADSAACVALSPLLLLNELPDHKQWQAYLSVPDIQAGWEAIAGAILASFDRHTRPAIDIRWMKIMFLGLQHRITIPQGKFDDVIQELCDYPQNDTESGKTEAMIGPLEMATNMLSEPSGWSEKFWLECFKKTPCISGKFNAPEPRQDFDYEPAKKRWGEIYAGLFKHFFQTLETTGIDARHDAVFGLALYGMSLLTGMMRPFSTRASGRHLLRSLAEVCITLAYLLVRDDPAIWQMYRNYGNGQAKLAFLKLAERDRQDLPKHVDMATLERLSNEDVWQEFVTIDLGQWANRDLRKMAEEAGVKDIYDSFYSWPSGFVHGNWAAVRDSVYDVCANPLHRFHRIPRPVRINFEDVCFDAVTIMNRILDLANNAYPKFILRFDDYHSSVVGS